MSGPKKNIELAEKIEAIKRQIEDTKELLSGCELHPNNEVGIAGVTRLLSEALYQSSIERAFRLSGKESK